MSVTKPLYSILAGLVVAIENCEKTGNVWGERHASRAHNICREWLPSGSGFDAGTQLLLEESNRNRLVFSTSFHHMDDHGSYDGWTDHKVIVTPDLLHGFTLRVTGRDRRDIKDYVSNAFHEALGGQYDEFNVLTKADR